MKRALFIAACAVAFGPVAAKPAPMLGPPSKAVTEDIVEIVAKEMQRQFSQLEIPGQPKPYYITYKITEVDVNDAAASLGQTTSKRNRHFVNLEARVRVDSAQSDNTNFVVPQAEEIDGVAAINLPLEATPRIAQRATWLVTDQAFKEALIQLRVKQEARRTSAGRDAPSFSPAPKVVSETPVLVAPLESLDEVETRAKLISSTFRDQPHVRDSRVAVTSYLERRWYISTEGTKVTDTRRASGVMIFGTGQANDGQPLPQYFLRYGHTGKDLPTDDELKAEAKKIADTIAQLAVAPIMDEGYRGPVLFEGEGAVGIIRATLAPHLGGTPVPEGLAPADAKTFGGALTDRVGQLAVSKLLSIHDDPTAKLGAGKALIGGYKIDDEGVPSQRVDVVRDGILKTLLTSRTPSAKGQISNGHARRTGEGGSFHGSATNLFVTGKNGATRAQLVQKLTQAAAARGLKYGVIIRRLDDAAITSAPDLSRRDLVNMIRQTDQQQPPPAILAYRVYPNGKQELVRGVRIGEVKIDAWEDVVAVSKDLTTYNFLAATESQLTLRLQNGTDEGFVPSGGIESAIITPDLLFGKIDLKRDTFGRPTPHVPKPK